MIEKLQLQHFRNIAHCRIEASPSLNLITGENGSGKSSLLEAINLIASGRSFRTNNSAKLIQHGHSALSVFTACQSAQGPVSLGLQRSNKEARIRINGENAQRMSELARFLPCTIIHPESYLLISGGPKLRRQYMDWGLFHQSPAFHEIWLNYRRVLSHCNALLRKHQPIDSYWREQLELFGEQLNAQRRDYVAQLSALFKPLFSELFGDFDVALAYREGVKQGLTLSDALDAHQAKDIEAGFVSVGPHRADLRIQFEGRLANEYVSRGQQKMLAVALQLAQLKLQLALQKADSSKHKPVLLLDDLSSELDAERVERFMGLSASLDVQVFVTELRAVPGLDHWPERRDFCIADGLLTQTN